MDRPERTEQNDTQKAKLIFLSLAALVAVLLVWSLYAANKAKTERDAARQETETLKEEYAKLEQLLKDQNQELDALKSKVQQCESKIKAKPRAKVKAAAKKKAAPAKNSKKSSKKGR